MAIDHRILLNPRAPSASQAIGIFENALNNAQTRDIRRQQAQQQAALAPLALQQQQQQIAQGEQQLSQGRRNQILQSVNDFAVQNQSVIEQASAGDALPLRSALEKRFQQLQQQGLPTETTEEGIAMIDAGNTQGVIKALNNSVNLYNQSQGRATKKAFAPITDPGTGQVSIPTFDPNTGQTNLVPVKGATSETPEQKRAAELAASKGKSAITRKTKAIDLAIKKGGEAFDRIAPLNTAIANYDEAIAAIDSGAETGVIDRFLPNIRESSIKLDNVKKRLGLDVIGNTTFGALSESELAFALDSALPTGLQPAQLKEWLTAKKRAQQKVLSRMEEAAQFLSSGENTIKDWVAYDKARQLNFDNEQPAQQVAPQAPAQQQAPATSRYQIEVID